MSKFKKLRYKHPSEAHEWERIEHIIGDGSYWQCRSCTAEVFMSPGKKPKPGEYRIMYVSGVPSNVPFEKMTCEELQAFQVVRM